MADLRFYQRSGPFSLQQLAESCSAKVVGDGALMIHDVAPIDKAIVGQVSFLENTKYVNHLQTTQASACIIHPDYQEKALPALNLLLTPQPYRAYAKVAALFYPKKEVGGEISEEANVHPSAQIGKNCFIGAFAVINAHAVIGDDCYIGPNTEIGEGVVIGNNCQIESHVTISHALLGKGVHIKPGARIGQKGFGFHMDENGHLSVPQLGRVIVGDDVEIGANTTVDRGSGPDTIIGRGTRIDNLVQIAHNVEIGEYCVIVAQAGVAGSSQLGKFVIVAGQVGIAGHLKIGDGVRIAAQSGIMRDVDSGETIAGSPAVPVGQWHRQTVALSKIAKQRGHKA